VGRTGGAEGIAGIDCGITAVCKGIDEEAVLEMGGVDAVGEGGLLVSSGLGDGCLLCRCQFLACATSCDHSRGDEETMSKAAGWVRYLVETVIKMSTKGTIRTAHLNLRPVRSFWS
jgi:hypothetical protein